MAKKKADKPAPPAVEPQPEPAAEPTPAPEPAATVTKAEAVRQAIAAGVDKPTDGVAYVKAKYGLDLTPAMFSTYKAIDAKKAGGGKKKRRGDEGPDGKAAAPAGEPAPATDASVEFVRQVRQLVERHGADAVRQMVGVFEG